MHALKAPIELFKTFKAVIKARLRLPQNRLHERQRTSITFWANFLLIFSYRALNLDLSTILRFENEQAS